uniref:Uncharacterized protein n=1 Tax=Tanacetum cinerariifolium TaxID=118510 RepID=A0A699RGX4_TANCI|nr:hypothetical protein [Tanacetum cinerariifolium]
MLHIYLNVHGQSFNEPPFEKEILAFIHFLGHKAVSLGLAAAVGGVIDVSELLLVLLTLALGLGGAAPQSTKLLRILVSGYQLDGGEYMVIPDIMPVHLVPPWNGRIL